MARSMSPTSTTSDALSTILNIVSGSSERWDRSAKVTKLFVTSFRLATEYRYSRS